MADPIATGSRCPARPGLAAAALGLSLLAGTIDLSAQPQGPIKLFPNLEQAEPDPRSRRPRQIPPETVRPEQPAPDEEAPIRVQGLDAPQVDAIGDAAGFDPSIWQGADPARVTALMTRLPLPERNRAIAETTRRLLLTGTLFDEGGSSGDVLAARVDRLLAMGALDDAAELVGQLPLIGTPAPLVRMKAESALWRGDDEELCRQLEESEVAWEEPFFAKLQVHCKMLLSDEAAADLALGLLRDGGEVDDARFLALADGDGGLEVDPIPPLSALHVAMLRRSGDALPAEALDEPEPALAAAVALDPALAPDDALRLAGEAFSRGGIDAEQLRRVYRENAPERGDALRLARNLPDLEARAAVLAAAEAGNDPAEGARLFDILWVRTEPADRLLVAHLLAPALARLAVRDDLLFAAASISRAMLATGQTGPAAAWHGLLRRSSSDDVSAREAAVRLVPLLAIAGAEPGAASAGFDPRAPEVWSGNGGARLLALAAGAGVGVPLAAWRPTLDDAAGSSGRLPGGYVWRVAERAAEAEIEGERMLAGLHLLGGSPRLAEPEAIIAGLRALAGAGRSEDARAIALAAAILDGR
jgi:hypothetical protein